MLKTQKSDTSKSNMTKLWLTVLIAVAFSACNSWSSGATPSGVAPDLPAAAPIASGGTSTEDVIRFLENKVKNDPEDFSANNKLAALYLQKLRETGNAQYLELATRAARTSLSSVPEVRNAGGLAALAQAEFAAHEFANARDHAVRLIEL